MRSGEIVLTAPQTSEGIKIYDNNGNLRTHIGQYASGKYGAKIINGTIYSTTIRSGAETDTSYIQLDPGFEPLKVVQDGKTALTIWAFSDWGGMIQWYDTSLNDMRGQILPYNDAIGQGLRIQGRNKVGTDMPLDIGGSGIYLAADTIDLETSFHGNGTYVTVWGDLHVTGDLSAGGSKPARQQTQSYGERYLYARESPDVRYIIEGKCSLTNGMCLIALNPIFLECIEPDTEVNPWLVHLTPYGDISLYVAEVGTDYILVKECNEGVSNATFAWSLSCVRRGYAGTWLEEVASDEDVLTSNWEDDILEGE